MVRKESCQTCKQKSDCTNVYRELGNAEGPPVTTKIVLAFLLPLVVFIVSLGVCERMFAAALSGGSVLTLVSFLMALLVTLTCIVMIKIIRRKLAQGEWSCS